MALYEMTTTAFRPIQATTFSTLDVMERGDMQRLLRAQIDVLGNDLYVLTEEFGEWEDSKRRIDLLAMDREANLVVIELKRTQDGGHMEFQALRYAGMVSAMTFDRAEGIHASYLGRIGDNAELAKDRMLAFLQWDEPDQEAFAPDVRIILVSHDFSKELTTAVLWLNDKGLDIRCIRMTPYLDVTKRLVDVQQIIPLPEAQEYQVQIRAKEQSEKKSNSDKNDLVLRFWQGLITEARSKNTRHGNLTPGIAQWIGASSGVRGLNLNYVVSKDAATVELYIDRGNAEENKEIFKRLEQERGVIHEKFGAELIWQSLPDRRASRIKYDLDVGGYRTSEAQWPQIHKHMVESMMRLEEALKGPISNLRL